jgi:hypothetical protein
VVASRQVPSFVIAGLDPAIHAADWIAQIVRRFLERRGSMDHRVKPGGDERLTRQSTRTVTFNDMMWA